MKQKATVIEVKETVAKVRVQRKSMCDGCNKGSCDGGCSMLKIFGGNRNFETYALNEKKAEVGDNVIVETSDKDVNLSAFYVFILPIITAFSVYLFFKLFLPEHICILLSVLSFALYFAVLCLTEQYRKKGKPDLRITEIVDNTENKNDKELV